MDKIIGVYKITSPTGAIYVGSSVDVKNRWSQYKSGSLNGKLKDSVLKFGYFNHLFEILEECNIVNIRERERYWQNRLSALNDFNLNSNYANSLERKGVKNKLFYFDELTGVYYNSVSEISDIYPVSHSTLMAYFYTNREKKIKNTFFKRFLKV